MAGVRHGLSHHTTNSEVVEDRGDEVDVRSKYLRLGQSRPGPMPFLIGQYVDTLTRTPAGWRISKRAIIAHGQ
ncbi:nuclear transport factor 2 family protein [Blastococcus montanus]|uniref:nuclear transport factor 2 family protein n=1 Tax=Blastococcus montanus TaxID=3144973 RepID=UPI003209E895